MSPTGDPSTFTFTMDAFPDYTKFNKTKKVIAAIQIVEDKDLYDGGVSDEAEDAKVDNEYHENSGKTPPGRFASANTGD